MQCPPLSERWAFTARMVRAAARSGSRRVFRQESAHDDVSPEAPRPVPVASTRALAPPPVTAPARVASPESAARDWSPPWAARQEARRGRRASPSKNSLLELLPHPALAAGNAPTGGTAIPPTPASDASADAPSNPPHATHRSRGPPDGRPDPRVGQALPKNCLLELRPRLATALPRAARQPCRPTARSLPPRDKMVDGSRTRRWGSRLFGGCRAGPARPVLSLATTSAVSCRWFLRIRRR